MGGIGTTLGAVELLGTLIVVLLLLGAGLAKPGRVWAFVVLAVVVGIVFANPFGVVARRSMTDPRPTTPTATADNATHWVKVAGVPVAWFKPYRQQYAYSGENAPTAALRLRYGFSFLPSTGEGMVVGMCSNAVTDPCWKPGDYPLVQRDADGKVWIVPLIQTPFGRSIEYLNVPHFYDIHIGVVSRWAFIYWFVAAGLIALAAARSSVRWRAVAVTAGVSLAAGALVSATLALVASPARGVDGLEPTLIPKAGPLVTARGTVDTTLISDQSYDPACVERHGRTTVFYCRRADQLTGVDVAGGILALWTASPHRRADLELRARRLTLAGSPIQRSRGVLAWSATAASRPGFVNCAQPIDIQAARIAGGRVLVAWSDRCIIFNRTQPDAIHGLVLDSSGRALGKPFAIVSVAPASSSEEAPEFALDATTAGRPLLTWVSKPKGSEYGASIFASFLDSRNRATAAHELSQQGGQMAVACAATCAIAVPSTRSIHLMFVGAHGELASTGDLRLRSSVINSSGPVLVARSHDFYVGWIESPSGVSATAKIAQVHPGGKPSVTTVWPEFSTGQSSSPTTPKPLGIGFVSGRPSMMWQVIAGSGSEAKSLLYVASAQSRTSRDIAPVLAEGAVPRPPAHALLAVAPVGGGQPDPVSVALPQP